MSFYLIFFKPNPGSQLGLKWSVGVLLQGLAETFTFAKSTCSSDFTQGLAHYLQFILKDLCGEGQDFLQTS